MSARSVAEFDVAADELRLNAVRWARLGFAGKIRHLRAMRAATVEVARTWAELAARAKGIAGTPLAGEEWLSGPYALLTALDGLGATLGSLARTGGPPLPARAVRTRAGGQVVVDVFPVSLADRLLLSGVHAEIWMEPGITRDEVFARTAAALRRDDPPGRVTLVLGAGNIASIPPLDVLAALYARNSVALLKLNPVNDYLEPVFARIFASLIDEDYVRLATGGAEAGAYLAAHPAIDAIHLTGSERTHRAVAAAAPGKPVTSELGNVTPVVVVPGPWTDADLRFQAAHIATMKLHNAGANCIAAQLLVTPAQWPRGEALVERVDAALRSAPARPSYYPGSVERFGEGRRLLRALDPGAEHPLFTQEAFAPVLAQTALPGAGAADFLRNAVRLVNERAYGTLGVSLLVHPRTRADLGAAFDEALAELRYGCVAVNSWPGVGFLLAGASWGAYPGHSMAEPGSGLGTVHNTFLFDRPQKTVLYQPFAPFPRSLRSLLPVPPWFVTHRHAELVARRLFAFAAAPSPGRLAATALAALRA